MNLTSIKRFLRIIPIPNLIGAIGFVALVGSLVRMLIKNRNAIIDFSIYKFPTIGYASGILAVGALIITAGSIILTYLNEDQVKEKRKKAIDDYSEKAIRQVLNSTFGEIAEIKALLINTSFAQNTNSEHTKELFKSITATISENLNNEFLKTIEDKYSDQIISEFKYKQIVENFQSINDRLNEEIFRLSRRASLNLFIGICTTAIAVFVLFASVYLKDTEIADWKGVIEYFAPRISITIFIEIFSFFFLKLYRTSLSDIKYYQNELTNIDFKVLALKSALLMNDKKSVEKIIQEFIKVERNFILKKGETTVDIEAFKNSNQYDESFSGVVKNLLDKLNSNTVKVKPKKTKKAEPEN